MPAIAPLPPYLVQRFHGWHATGYAANRAWYRRLSDGGQRPRAMVIACCDSRVHVTSIFGADSGEFFIHRNIANLVPPFKPDGEEHGTSAAIEYGVTELRVAQLIVMGHTNCGGVNGCLAMCSGRAPELDKETSFTGRWMDILRPGYERIAGLPESEQIGALEQQAVLISLENLMTFPFVAKAIESEEMTLHGLVHDIGSGVLVQYDGSGFAPV